MEQCLRKFFTLSLEGYASDYLEKNGSAIPKSYLKTQLETAVKATLNDPNFLKALEEDPMDMWEGDGFREFCDASTILKDYPM